MVDEKAVDQLFDEEGNLKTQAFSDSAYDVLKKTREFLIEIERDMYLPLDLLTVLVELGETELSTAIASGTDGTVGDRDVSARLRVLATEIEEESPDTDHPRELNRHAFSRGFTRILMEAHDFSKARGERNIERRDLVSAVLWRAESVESASVRWAIRRLGEGAGDVMFDKRGILRESVFDDAMWQLLVGAVSIAAGHGTPFLGTPHLVAMMCSVRGSILWRSAKARGLEPGRLREELLRLIGSKPAHIPEFHIGRKTLTPRMVRMLAQAQRAAEHEPVSETNVVEAFLSDGGSSLELIQALGLESEIRRCMGDPKVLAEALPVEAAIQLGARQHSTPTLDLLGRDLTADALEGRLPEIVGRENELQRVINVLLRREQRNPLLTGEAGVGKTALAIALAQRIASGRVPKKLKGHRVVEINGASLMSGTSYRGDLESRIKGLLEEASDRVILFIDEAHAVFAPRAGSHAPAEVPNHFKSALASGEIAVVAATTESEYRRWFEQDPALKRRFEQIEVGEPTPKLVREILTSLVDELERDYEVSVNPDAVEAAIDLSVRFLPEQRLPDKAKKLLMDACIACANELTNQEVENLTVDTRHVAEQIVSKTGVPIERVVRGQTDWWVGIEDRINAKIIGQQSAVHDLAKALVTGRIKRANDRRPLGVFAFVGPPSSGKTTLARLLSEQIFGDEKAFFKLDMTDFQESHSMSRLIGSPPGYVGYEDEDVLVTPLRRRPSSVVLLQDFDKAHPRVQDRILRLIEEGSISDTRGYSADASHAVFIITVNKEVQNERKIGFGSGSDAELFDDDPFLKRIRTYMDALIPFRAPGSDPDTIIELLEHHVESFVRAMEDEYQIGVVVSEALRDEMLSRAQTDPAHDLRAIVESLLLDPTTDALLTGGRPKSIELDWNDLQGDVTTVAQ